MNVIITKFLPPTDHKGARISVKLYWTRPKIYSWDHSLSVLDNHRRAAERFVYDFGWGEWVDQFTLVCGELSPSTYIYTIVAKSE